MKIVAIDVGLVNLGLVIAQVTPDYQLDKIEWVGRVDLTTIPHRHIARAQCTLHHTRDAVDRVQHFIQEYEPLLTGADVVLIERQPITGLVHVEQLLYHAFRDRAQLCSPNVIHRHFQMAKGDYEKRKRQSVERARPYLQDQPGFIECEARQHDVADALVMLLWWTQTQCRERDQAQLKQDRQDHFAKQQGASIDDYFEQFRFSSAKERE